MYINFFRLLICFLNKVFKLYWNILFIWFMLYGVLFSYVRIKRIRLLIFVVVYILIVFELYDIFDLVFLLSYKGDDF